MNGELGLVFLMILIFIWMGLAKLWNKFKPKPHPDAWLEKLLENRDE